MSTHRHEPIHDYSKWVERCTAAGWKGPFKIAGTQDDQQFTGESGTAALWKNEQTTGYFFDPTPGRWCAVHGKFEDDAEWMRCDDEMDRKARAELHRDLKVQQLRADVLMEISRFEVDEVESIPDLESREELIRTAATSIARIVWMDSHPEKEPEKNG